MDKLVEESGVVRFFGVEERPLRHPEANTGAAVAGKGCAFLELWSVRQPCHRLSATQCAPKASRNRGGVTNPWNGRL